MAFKTILTVTGLDHGDGDLKVAAALCRQIDAHLSVLVIALAAPPPIGEYAAMTSDGWLEERQSDLEQLKERTAAVSAFSPVANSQSISPANVRRSHGPTKRLGDARVTPTSRLLARGCSPARRSRRRCLRVRCSLPANRCCSFPKVRSRRWSRNGCWSRGIRASRHPAPCENLSKCSPPQMKCAFVLVDPVEGENHHGAEPGADAAAYLARHCVKVTVDRMPNSGHSVAEVLRRHAVDTSAELMVMGAYGHSRLRERIFGGVTKSMLEDPSLPILMAR